MYGQILFKTIINKLIIIIYIIKVLLFKFTIFYIYKITVDLTYSEDSIKQPKLFRHPCAADFPAISAPSIYP